MFPIKAKHFTGKVGNYVAVVMQVVNMDDSSSPLNLDKGRGEHEWFDEDTLIIPCDRPVVIGDKLVDVENGFTVTVAGCHDGKLWVVYDDGSDGVFDGGLFRAP